MDALIPLLVIAGLIWANGLFVAAEFALLSAPRPAIERRAAAGHPLAAWVHQTLRTPRLQDRYVATAQLGITASSLGLGMYGEHVLAGGLAPFLEDLGAAHWIAAHTLASVLAVACLTYFHIVFGEAVPKSLALMHPERAMLWVARPMRWIGVGLYPLVASLERLGNAILRLMGIERRPSAGSCYTPEELELIVRESQEGGKLKPESGQVLQELFDFESLTAGQVMVPRVRIIGLPLETSLEQLQEVLRRAPHTRYPVYEGDLDHIAGVVHIKDLFRLLLARRPLERGDVRPVAFVPETAELDTVIDAMRRTRTQMVIVMDEHGGTAGLVAIDDLSTEMVGQVGEGDRAGPDFYRDEAGRLRVSGTLRLEELGEPLGVALEHEEVDTVSGLVLALLDRPPKVGDAVSYAGVRFEVSAIEGHGVRECVVALVEPPAS